MFLEKLKSRRVCARRMSLLIFLESKKRKMNANCKQGLSAQIFIRHNYTVSSELHNNKVKQENFLNEIDYSWGKAQWMEISKTAFRFSSLFLWENGFGVALKKNLAVGHKTIRQLENNRFLRNIVLMTLLRGFKYFFSLASELKAFDESSSFTMDNLSTDQQHTFIQLPPKFINQWHDTLRLVFRVPA